MSDRGKWTEGSALEFLARLGVKPMGDRTLEINATEIGSGAWGAVDYLTHYCGYKRGKAQRVQY